MTVFYWIALVLLLANAIPSALFFASHLASGNARSRLLAIRFFRWAALVVLVAFNVTIFRHVILILVRW